MKYEGNGEFRYGNFTRSKVEWIVILKGCLVQPHKIMDAFTWAYTPEDSAFWEAYHNIGHNAGRVRLKELIAELNPKPFNKEDWL